MNKSIEFLNSLNDVWNMDIPEEVMARAKHSLLDYIAVTCAGAKFQEEKLDKYFEYVFIKSKSFAFIFLHNSTNSK